MKSYQDILKHILSKGEVHNDRTGVGTISSFGYQFRHNMQEGFPLVTTKRMTFKGVYDELAWFYSGSTNVFDLPKHIQHWWTPFADDSGELGHTYGKNLRAFPTFGGQVDQLKCLFDDLGNNSQSRRLIMSTWNAGTVRELTLPSCHGLVIQFKCYDDGRLSLSTYQRSADAACGIPVNIAHYGLLLEMVAACTNRVAHELIYTFGDLHIYSNHIELMKEQVELPEFDLPTLEVHANPDLPSSLSKFKGIGYGDLELTNYVCHPAIKTPMAV